MKLKDQVLKALGAGRLMPEVHVINPLQQWTAFTSLRQRVNRYNHCGQRSSATHSIFMSVYTIALRSSLMVDRVNLHAGMVYNLSLAWKNPPRGQLVGLFVTADIFSLVYLSI